MVLEDCLVSRNVAQMQEVAFDATGGGVAVSETARVALVATTLFLNAAGGAGMFESMGSTATASGQKTVARGGYIDCTGNLAIERCSFPIPAESPAESAGRMLHSASAMIAVRGLGRVTVVNSTIAAVSPNAVLLRLAEDQSEALLRGCTITNATVEALQVTSGARLGVTNCSIDPPLALSAAIVQTPNCGVVIAGDRVCDPRAKCEPRSSGGVQCSCDRQGGLRDKSGTIADGSECEQETQVEALIQSRSITIRLHKPSLQSELGQVTMALRAFGESPVVATFSMTMARLSAFDTAVNRSEWNSVILDEFTLDGHHLTLGMSSPGELGFDLDVHAQRFMVQKEHAVHLSVDCNGEQNCIADGEKVITTVEIGAPLSSSSGSKSVVRITAEVSSWISCMRSVAWVAWRGASTRARSISIDASSSLSAHVLARDVDGLPINYTRVDLDFSFNNMTIPVVWNRGRNEYVATVGQEQTAQPGDYDLVVHALHGFNETAQQVVKCELLRLTISVTAGFNTSLVLGISASGCLMFVVGLLLWVRRVRDKLRRVLEMVLAEGIKLIVGITFELGDFVTDVRPTLLCCKSRRRCFQARALVWIAQILTVYRVVLANYHAARENRIAYALFGALAVITSTFAISQRIRHFCQVRSQISDAMSQDSDTMQRSESSLTSRLKWELVKTPATTAIGRSSCFSCCWRICRWCVITASQERSNGRMQFGALIRSA